MNAGRARIEDAVARISRGDFDPAPPSPAPGTSAAAAPPWGGCARVLTPPDRGQEPSVADESRSRGEVVEVQFLQALADGVELAGAVVDQGLPSLQRSKVSRRPAWPESRRSMISSRRSTAAS